MIRPWRDTYPPGVKIYPRSGCIYKFTLGALAEKGSAVNLPVLGVSKFELFLHLSQRR
jgi:hypothetical protein